MSSDSIAALVVGALLAGASALKIAGRRARPQGGIWSSYMKKVRWVSATAGAALVAAMFALPGAGVAYASDNGADLLLLGVAALGTIGVGAGAVAVARRRRNSEV
jgi:cytochrome b561